MKITIFSQHFWPENFRINDIAVKLKKLGVHVNVFTGKPNYPDGLIKPKYQSLIPKKDKYLGIDILRFPIVSRGKASFLRLALNYFSYILSLSFFSFFYKKKLGDIFFVYATSPIFQAIPAILLAKIFNSKVILWIQDLWPENLKDTNYINNSFFLSIVNFLVIRIYNASNLILCQSNQMTKLVKKKTRVQTKTFYNPSNYNFNYKKKIKSLYYDIYYTGNLGKGQNLDKVIEVFKNKKIIQENIRLFIYGGGKNFDLIKIKINQLKLKNVYLKKSISPKKLKDKIKSADCFLLKLNNGDGLSKTIPAKFQTYLSFGKPIISINKGVVSQIILKHRIGFQCNTEKKTNLINTFLEAKKLSQKKYNSIMINSHKLFFKEFEINNSCKKLKNYLEEL